MELTVSAVSYSFRIDLMRPDFVVHMNVNLYVHPFSF